MTHADWSSMGLLAAAPRSHLAAVLAVGGAVLYVIGIAGLKVAPWILSRHERRLDDDRRVISRQMEQVDPAAPAARRTRR